MFDRAQFGSPWTDDTTAPMSRNGCDTRNDILRTQLHDPRIKPGTHGCKVIAGTLHDRYSGVTIRFVRGAQPTSIDIDHVVSLRDAWQSGAHTWTADRRARFANDPANLVATSASLNRSKGDSTADEWMPPHSRCWFATKQRTIKVTYRLSARRAERAAWRAACAGSPA